MKLEQVILEGFRGYGERTEIPIDNLTAFIGQNDVGKSTILEALDAFFNDTVDVQDVNTRTGEGRFMIGCVFSDLPEQINVDSHSTTTLGDEYLLNADEKLELYKVWRTTATKAEVERIFAKAYAPSSEEARDLLFRKRDELKDVIEEHRLEADKRKNPAMREAIYRHFETEGLLHLEEREVELDRPRDKRTEFEDARRIWKKLNDRHLPVYSLFKAEQVHGDKESAVRSPLDVTLKQAISDLEEDLTEIEERIQERVQQTTEQTLARLRQDYPDVAKTLVPKYKSPNWAKAFDLQVLQSDNDIPLNKRGAGIRRLVVLAFFQAEAEKKQNERAEDEATTVPPVIYAIEEPETSQHPEFQKNIIQSLEILANSGDQVLLTTHVPGMAKLLPTSSIRFIDNPESSRSPRIRSGKDNESVLTEAATSLGVLPYSIPQRGAQVAVWVEGETDVWVLDSIAQRLADAGELPTPLDADRIYYVIGAGGDKLQSYVNGQYLDTLDLPQFYLRDSDRDGPHDEGKPIPEDVAQRVKAWEERGEGLPIKVIKTKKREIENYMNCAAVDRVCEVSVDLESRVSDIDWDYDQISKTDDPIWQELRDAKSESEFRWPEESRRGIPINYRKPKHVICGLVIPEMTLDELRERCAPTDSGSTMAEIDEWFNAMAELVESAD